jgi:hypothetical protein
MLQRPELPTLKLRHITQFFSPLGQKIHVHGH